MTVKASQEAKCPTTVEYVSYFKKVSPPTVGVANFFLFVQ